MLSVESRSESTNEASTDTHEIETYTDTVYGNHRRSRYEELDRKNVDRNPNQGEEQQNRQIHSDLQRYLTEVQTLAEDPDSTVEQELEAIERMEACMKEMKRRTNYYGNRKAQLVQLRNIQTRSQRRTEGAKTKTSTDSDTEIKNTDDGTVELDENIYEEYDRHYEAFQEKKRRVRFQQEAEFEEISHVSDTVEVRQDQPRAKKSQKKRIEKIGVGKEEEKDKKPPEEYDMYKSTEYLETTGQGIRVYRDDKFAAGSNIDEVSDFTLAKYLMENSIPL
jgi:hypothetical protein